MIQFNRIMVGLDFTATDKVILEYAKMLQGAFKPSMIYFVHAEEDLDDIPQEILEEYGADILKPHDEGLLEKLEATVAEYFTSDSETEISCQVVEGGPFKEMLHWSHIKQIDLLIVGKKNQENGKGVLPQKLARKIDSSVLFVPENYTPKKIERVLLPLDFSKKSKMALQLAARLFEGHNVELMGAHCYTLPLGWSKTGKTREEFEGIMQAHATRKFEDYMEGFDDEIKVKSVFEIDENREPSEEIISMAEKTDSDLILIGSRGKTDIATVILGSTTEKLLSHHKPIPILMAKKKGETIGFLEALFKLK